MTPKMKSLLDGLIPIFTTHGRWYWIASNCDFRLQIVIFYQHFVIFGGIDDSFYRHLSMKPPPVGVCSTIKQHSQTKPVNDLQQRRVTERCEFNRWIQMSWWVVNQRSKILGGHSRHSESINLVEPREEWSRPLYVGPDKESQQDWRLRQYFRDHRLLSDTPL